MICPDNSLSARGKNRIETYISWNPKSTMFFPLFPQRLPGPATAFNLALTTLPICSLVIELALFFTILYIISACCCSAVEYIQLSATQWTTAHQASLSFTISWSLLKLMSIKSVMPSNYLILCCPLLFLPSIFPRMMKFFFKDR